jgi:hypothetical protein
MEGEGGNGDIVSMSLIPCILLRLQDATLQAFIFQQPHYPTTPLTRHQHWHGTESLIVCEGRGLEEWAAAKRIEEARGGC